VLSEDRVPVLRHAPAAGAGLASEVQDYAPPGLSAPPARPDCPSPPGGAPHPEVRAAAARRSPSLRPVAEREAS